MRLSSLARRLFFDLRGTLPVELALVLPVLILLLVGAADIAWLYIANDKVQRAAAVIADLVGRTNQIAAGDVDDSFEAAREVAWPLDLAASGRAFVSSVRNLDATGARVAWQRATSSGLAVASRIGTPGGSADLDGALVLASGEEIVVGEVFLDVSPIFGLFIAGPQRLYARALQRPRYGTVQLVEGGSKGATPSMPSPLLAKQTPIGQAARAGPAVAPSPQPQLQALSNVRR